ncbi:hypothetical protein [Roseibium sp. RKSG952]|uniref:hypothetical protein n=1 Tax=Roseibium sp. RKSG952 TaxID=2529384 RepID=UPI0012BC5E3C|nr:hypothetical protein [Roseibium sp. RKSG952]MTH95395.1 hypothetical protein [Roseibium sp. RKSG952]
MSIDLTSVSDEDFFAELQRRSRLKSDPLSYVIFSSEGDLLPILEEFNEVAHLTDEERGAVAKTIMILMRSNFQDLLSSEGNEAIPTQISLNLNEALDQLGLSKNAPAP